MLTTRNHAIFLLGRMPLLQSNMLINTKAFSSTASQAFSSTIVANRSAPFPPTYHRLDTASRSRRLAWSFMPGKFMDVIDSGAAKLAFQKSNPFNDPEAHNCKISFLPDDKYATWTKGYLQRNMGMPLPRRKEAYIVRRQLDKVVGPHIGEVSYECIAK